MTQKQDGYITLIIQEKDKEVIKDALLFYSFYGNIADPVRISEVNNILPLFTQNHRMTHVD